MSLTVVTIVNDNQTSKILLDSFILELKCIRNYHSLLMNFQINYKQMQLAFHNYLYLPHSYVPPIFPRYLFTLLWFSSIICENIYYQVC